jgi:hypothetical protein
MNILKMFRKKSKEGTRITNRNEVHDEIRRRINSGNSCCYAVRKLL